MSLDCEKAKRELEIQYREGISSQNIDTVKACLKHVAAIALLAIDNYDQLGRAVNEIYQEMKGE